MKSMKKRNLMLFLKNRRERGSILMLTMMIMLLLTLMAISILALTANAIHMTSMRRSQAEAFNIAESGCEVTALWFRSLSFPETRLSPFSPEITMYDLGGNTYSVTVYPDADNAINFLKTFTIKSTGTVRNMSVTIQVVLRQASFGRFAYYTDSETSVINGVSLGAIWWETGNICDGPAHSNNTGGKNFQINWSGSVNPIFLDILTGAGTSITYNTAPKTETDYRKIYLDGSKGFRLGVPRIELPTATTAQKEAAWGSAAGFPTTTGVSLRANNTGGIYISGDSTIQFVRNSDGTQNIVIGQSPTTNTTSSTKSGDTTTIKTDTITNNTVTVNLAAGTSVMLKELVTTVTTTHTKPVSSSTTVTKSTLSTVNAGLPNGVIYTDGNITSLSGEIADNIVSDGKITVRSAWTIATDTAAGKDITITDNLFYHTRPDKTKLSSDPVNLASGTLGLVSADIVIPKFPIAPSTDPHTNLEIDAVCMAGSRNVSGSFYVADYDTKTPKGTLKLIGGIIQKNRGPVGTVGSTGYNKNYIYDTRMALNPPPFYPTTGTYERLSWQIVH